MIDDTRYCKACNLEPNEKHSCSAGPCEVCGNLGMNLFHTNYVFCATHFNEIYAILLDDMESIREAIIVGYVKRRKKSIA